MKPPLTLEEIQKAKVLKANGHTYCAIGRELKRDHKTIQKHLTEPEAVEDIRRIQDELTVFYADIARRMLASITDQDIGRINALQRTTAAAIATDKMRLLTDKSTQNVSIQEMATQIQADIGDLKRVREILLEEERRESLAKVAGVLKAIEGECGGPEENT
ncbi:MAG: hypothetical protein A4E65_00988 [Syntrophorhabdus sp. PtaU1.Bin153]|nr:MAG: hypothetical protein A4E65_00988 [Syntrophorhabdus sp. PtaU1.Bin153]